MISEKLNNLENNDGMKIPEDFRQFIEKNCENIYDWAFSEVSVGDRIFVFNNFLGDTGELNTDLYLWYKFDAYGSEYLTFGNGVYGESFVIKIKGKDIGRIEVVCDEEGEKHKFFVAYSFTEFMKKLQG